MTSRVNTYYSSLVTVWDIAYEIMIRSIEPLTLTLTHPGGEQYECLTLMKKIDVNRCALLINLHGDSILANGKLIEQYKELYKKDKRALLSDISIICGYRLASKVVRELPSVDFIKQLIKKYGRDSSFRVNPAWYDGSYSSRLDDAARNFPHYVFKDSKDKRHHLPWWTISYADQTLAICNLETNELITLRGRTRHLQNEEERKQAMAEISSDIKLNEINQTVLETIELIRANDEWIGRYRDYARLISDNLDNIKQSRNAFREWSPLKFYLNVTNAKKAAHYLTLGVRYNGQEVAELISNPKNETLLLNTTTNDYDKKNAKYFDWQKSLNKVDWRGSEAKAFRAFFKNNPPRIDSATKKNNEHRIESLLLSEFSKKSSAEKALPYIQPVKIGGIRFPMPTPIGASSHKVISYSKEKGGGIDILARVGKSGFSAKLCIIELKDENDSKEQPIDVIKQAVAYATFIRELLRSECGSDWWKLFGFSRPLPKKLTLFAACAMPSGNNDYSFANKEVKIEDDVIRLHYIYFHEKDNAITSVESSLNGQRDS